MDEPTGKHKLLQSMVEDPGYYLQRFIEIINAMPDIIFIMDREGNYIDFKTGLGKVYIDENKILNSNIRDHSFSEGFIEKILEHIRTAIDTGMMHLYEYKLPFANGEIRSYESRCVRINDNHVLRLVRDTTEQEKNARLLSQRNTELLLKSQQLRLYAFTVSHSLRSPITNVLSILNLYKEKMLTEEEKDLMFTAMQEEILKIDELSKNMSNSVKDYLPGDFYEDHVY